MSMQRAPGPPEETTRGSSMNFPFWPGGFDEPEDALSNFKHLSDVCLDFENNLLTIPPGFSSGLEFKREMEINEEGIEDVENIKIEEVERPVTIDLRSIVDQENDILGMWNISMDSQPRLRNLFNNLKVDDQLDESLLESKTVAPIVEISESVTKKIVKTDWAEIIGNFRNENKFSK